MGSYRIMGTSVLAAVAACGGSKAGQASTATQADSGATAVVKSTMATVIGAEGEKPPCPVTARWDAVLTVYKMSGTLQYRWERSDSVNGKTLEVSVPAGARTEPSDITLDPFDWPDTQPGVQLNRWARVHILSPIDSRSSPTDVPMKCY